MKKLLLLVLLAIASVQITFAQYESPYKSESGSSSNTGKQPNFYIGIGAGFNYKTGLLGVSFSYRMAPKLLTELNLGIGGYGGKIGLGAVFNAVEKSAWCPTLSFSRSSGIQDFETEVEVEYLGKNSKTTTAITLPAMIVLTPGVQRQFVGKNGNRFVLELGLSIQMNTATPVFVDNLALVEGTYVPTSLLKFSTTQKQVFKVMDPAGLSFGLTYYFGFKPKG